MRVSIASSILAASLSIAAYPVLAGDITGPAIVTDGDSIKIDGQRIRIHGIDAPERKQTCTYPNGEEWPCGSAATALMADLVADHAVTCEQQDVDRYGRIVAICPKDSRWQSL